MHKLSKPQCRIIGIQQGQNVQGEGQKNQRANKPGGEPAKWRKSQTPRCRHSLWFVVAWRHVL